jgi:superfamily II DNA or RNA helicase
VIYKENRDDWRKAEIVVTTVQSLLFNNKYQRCFRRPTFDLVISDEAHRSIGGNARAVFDYFIGYKLGLTATPRDYLKKFDSAKAQHPRPARVRAPPAARHLPHLRLRDGQPTFRYSLLDGVKDGFLINPTVVDARTEVTTQLLSEEGFVVEFRGMHRATSGQLPAARIREALLLRSHQPAVLQDLSWSTRCATRSAARSASPSSSPSASTTPPSWRRSST